MARLSHANPQTAGRPFAFLVSHDGSAANEALAEALAPVLDQLGRWRRLDHPESRLAFAAAREVAEGYRPIHLALVPPHACYLSRVVPNVLFPVWPYPDVPMRDFGHDTRQNWARVCDRASLVLTTCSFTADAIIRAGVRRPVAVVPVPITADLLKLPRWESGQAGDVLCRHAELFEPVDTLPTSPMPAPMAPGLIVLGKREATRWLRKLVWGLPRRSAHFAYRKAIKPRLGRSAVLRIERVGRALRTSEDRPAPPPFASAPLASAGGPVYLADIDPADDPTDLLSAFLLAFRDRPDATLVLCLETDPEHEGHDLATLSRRYRALHVSHCCRVFVVTERLSDDRAGELLRLSAYYVSTRSTDGMGHSLARALAGGRPAIAPGHSALGDLMGSDVGFVLRTDPEPCPWPHDPEQRLETFRHRVLWSSVLEALKESARVVDHEPGRYAAMSEAARRRPADHDACANALRAALTRLSDETGPDALAG